LKAAQNGLAWGEFNAGKLGLTLNANSLGREAVLDLVRWADVIFDSFVPGARATWGFDYESLRKINPKDRAPCAYHPKYGPQKIPQLPDGLTVAERTSGDIVE